MSTTLVSTSKVEQMRNHFFYETFNVAKRDSPFYRNLYKTIELEGKDYRKDLQKLPLIDSDTIIKNQSAITVNNLDLQTHHRTGGTTGHVPILIHRSKQEAEMRDEVASLAFQGGKEKKLVVLILDVFHGYPWIPRSSNLYTACFTIFSFNEATEFLTNRPPIPGVESDVESIYGSLDNLKRLTHFLLGKGIDPKTLHVKHLVSNGFYVPKKWREVLQRIWGAKLIDIYAISEILGNIGQCLSCGAYHPSPSVVAEVVSIDNHSPIKQGTGLLVLTALYPFQQSFPLLRYNTGDLFEITEQKCVDIPLAPKGRFSRSVYVRLSEAPNVCFVPSSDIADLIEEIPDINRGMVFAGPQKAVFLDDLSWEFPRFSVQTNAKAEKPVVRFNLELNYDPVLYPSRIAEIGKVITEGLCKRSSSFEESLREGLISFENSFLPPNSIPWDEVFER